MARIIAKCRNCGEYEFTLNTDGTLRCENCGETSRQQELQLVFDFGAANIVREKPYDWKRGTPEAHFESVFVYAENAFGQGRVFQAGYDGVRWFTHERCWHENHRKGDDTVSTVWKILAHMKMPEVPEEVKRGEAPHSPWQTGTPEQVGLSVLVCAVNANKSFTVFPAYLSYSGFREWCTDDVRYMSNVKGGFTRLHSDWKVICWQPMPEWKGGEHHA